MIKPTVYPDHEAMSRAAADWVAARVSPKPDSLICLATGATPMRAYELLAGRGRELLKRTRILKLDEWAGLPMRSPATCEIFLRRTLIEPLGLEDRYVGFNSEVTDIWTECERIAKWLAENGPIDLCVLGLGVNGHLGFNEPAEVLQAHAHVAKLSKESLGHSMIAEEKTKPTAGLTLGMADLLQAREILLVASGASKREPMRRVMSGEITTQFPGTFLQMHPKAAVFCDSAAWQAEA